MTRGYSSGRTRTFQSCFKVVTGQFGAVRREAGREKTCCPASEERYWEYRQGWRQRKHHRCGEGNAAGDYCFTGTEPGLECEDPAAGMGWTEVNSAPSTWYPLANRTRTKAWNKGGPPLGISTAPSSRVSCSIPGVDVMNIVAPWVPFVSSPPRSAMYRPATIPGMIVTTL